ncbi:hypothetical protein CTI12_AA469080 [Artemisia annua]|uniref:Helitron helicase-like domain-containing protein n=1 Tax=Artemisia annua TaxID=35608 RepID=A0A2U1LP25_ARTAN|nr:hypothetical protein CTI12_AA469080 [Artemisia annua]
MCYLSLIREKTATDFPRKFGQPIGAEQPHVGHAGEGASSDVQRLRKRGRPRNACASVHGDTEMADSHATLSATAPRKRPAHGHLSSAACDRDRSQNIAEGVNHAGEGASSHVQQPQKRAARRPRKRPAHAHQSSAPCDHDCSQNITETINHAGEGASSHVQQPRKRGRSQDGSTSMHVVPGMRHSHGSETASQPQKRGRRTHQSFVAEGSTSYAPDNAAPAYDDLGDCTERCNYCNAAFWRGERLADLPPLDPQIVQDLIHFLDAHNELVQIFRIARDKCAEADVPEFKIRLYSGDKPRGYELPSSNTLGAIVFDRGPESESNYDVIVEYIDGPLKRISKIHKSYMSLQFPLIFIYGQPGYHTKLMLRTANPDDEPKRVSMNSFYTYQMHPRHDRFKCLANLLATATYGSSQVAVALSNEGRDEQKKGDQTLETSVALLNKPIEQDKQLKQHDLQKPDKMVAPSLETSEIHAKIKHEETPHAAVRLPKEEVQKEKEIRECNLEAPTNLVIDTKESSGTPPETLHFVNPKPLKTTNKQDTPQGSGTKTAKRALFQSQPTESKKQKGKA